MESGVSCWANRPVGTSRGGNHMKASLPIALCFVLAALQTLYGGDQATITLGAMYNLTGGMAPIDLPAYNGAKLAVKLINDTGGVVGKRLKLIRVNTRTDLKKVFGESEKLLAGGIDAGLGYGDTNYVLEAAPYFQQKGIPFVTSGATDPQLPTKIGSCLFMVAYGDDDQAFAVAEFARNSLKARDVVIWTDTSMEFTRLLAKFFRERFESLGGRVVDEDVFKHGDTDFSALNKRLKALSPQPDALFVSAVPEEAVPTVDQIRKAGILLPILSGDGFDADLTAKLASPDVCTRIYFATHSYRGVHSKRVEAFAEEYKREYGKEPENAFAALGYDAVSLIADAAHRAGSADPRALKDALAATKDFQGVTGSISYTRPSRVPVKPVSIVGIENGRYQVMETWKP